MDPEVRHFFVDIGHFESPVYGLAIRPHFIQYGMSNARCFVCQAAMNLFAPLES